MLKVGITGGIGSGKSIVCQVFTTLGIPVFNADDAARYLMENDAALISQISELLGDDVYTDGKLNRSRVSELIFQERNKLQALNSLVHPATIRYGKRWMDSQDAPYSIKEAAIFFESGSNKDMDMMVGIFAPKEVRLQRAMKRGESSQGQVLAIMNKQMDEEEKMKLCDHVITNDDKKAIIPQVLQLHQLLLSRHAATR
ncbi:MAG: dephospho-CoA kinase [Flavipsychrobacter sp.]|nr:dephospho-CoA kinase [Flavipsychrobacter sp.]